MDPGVDPCMHPVFLLSREPSLCATCELCISSPGRHPAGQIILVVALHFPKTLKPRFTGFITCKRLSLHHQSPAFNLCTMHS